MAWWRGHCREQEQRHLQRVSKLIAENQALVQRVHALEGVLRQYAHLHFGRKTEQGGLPGAEPAPIATGPATGEQGVPAADSTPPVVEEAAGVEGKPKRGQVRGAPGHGRSFGRDLPRAEEVLLLPEHDLACPHCQTPYILVPGMFIKSSVADWVVVLSVTDYVRPKYRRGCSCADQPLFRTAPPPPKVVAKGGYSPRFLARLCLEKFELARPANKVCQSLALEGAALSPGTVSGLYRHAMHLLEPLGREIHAYVRAQQHAHSDETGFVVLDDDQARRRWWLWVLATEQAVAFLLDPHRSAAVLRTYYGWTEHKPLSPGLTLVSDALPTYTRLALEGCILQALCWAHQRRRLRDAGRNFPELARWAEQWRLRIVRLYQLHRARRQTQAGSPDWLAADAALRAHVQQIREDMERELRHTSLHPAQRRALDHLRLRWEGYTRFLDDPLLPLDNNLAERLLRTAVLCRKNSGFIGADWAAACAALLWSVLHTAKRNGLNPLTYLTAYFQACAEHGGLPLSGPELARFLPWALSPTDKATWSAPLPVAIPAGLRMPSPTPAARAARPAAAPAPQPASPATPAFVPPAPCPEIATDAAAHAAQPQGVATAGAHQPQPPAEPPGADVPATYPSQRDGAAAAPPPVPMPAVVAPPQATACGLASLRPSWGLAPERTAVVDDHPWREVSAAASPAAPSPPPLSGRTAPPPIAPTPAPAAASTTAAPTACPCAGSSSAPSTLRAGERAPYPAAPPPVAHQPAPHLYAGPPAGPAPQPAPAPDVPVARRHRPAAAASACTRRPHTPQTVGRIDTS